MKNRSARVRPSSRNFCVGVLFDSTCPPTFSLDETRAGDGCFKKQNGLDETHHPVVTLGFIGFVFNKKRDPQEYGIPKKSEVIFKGFVKFRAERQKSEVIFKDFLKF